MATPNGRVIDLTSIRERTKVKLDCGIRELRAPDDLTIEEYQVLAGLLPRYGTLIAKETRTPAEAQERIQLAQQLADMALVASPEEIAALSDVQRTLVSNLFTELCLPRLADLLQAGAAPMEDPSRGATSSPDLPASTAAPRRSGRRKSR